jgi:GST-like protein
VIELHTTPTANGYKASIMLEELGLPYRVHDYNLVRGDHLAPGYLALNPVGRMPTIVDDAVDGGPVSVYGTAAILLYLAERSGQLLPRDLARRARVFEWLGIVSSDIAPAYTGQFVFNQLAPEKFPWAIDHYNRLCSRLVAPMEAALGRSPYLAGDAYSIADVIAYPVAAVSMRRFPGSLDAYPNLARWAATIGARPAVQRGMRVPS